MQTLSGYFMIEIKITIDTALNLLLNRMKVELKFRQSTGEIAKELRLENLSYKQLNSIVESAIFDTVFLLPIDLITQETNLNYIVTGTVKSLSRIFHREEFSVFTSKRARILLDPIYEYFKAQSRDTHFNNN